MEVALSKKYRPLFQWNKCKKDDPLQKVDTVIITGGRYSQKSFASGLFSCVSAKDFKHRILYTRYTLTAAEDSIIPEFNEKIDILNCNAAFETKKDRIIGHNGSKIVFKGIKTSSGNQTAALKSLKNFSMFILEEAEEMPNYEGWDKIKKSIRALDVRNLSILILNPATKEHWVYTEFFEARGVQEGFNGIVGNVLYIHSTYLDLEREFIPDSIFEDFEDKRAAYEYYESLSQKEKDICDAGIVKKAKYYKHVVLGGWLDVAEGVVFTNWSIGQFEEPTPSVFGQDFGFSVDPTTLVQTSIDKSRKKIYVKELLYKPRLTTSMIIEENKRYAGKSLIYADSAEPRLIDEMRRAGCNIRETIKGQGSVSAGIAALQDFEIVIDPGSINLIKEFNNYVWHDKKSKTPVDAWNHGIDSLRYATYPELSRVKKVWQQW
ncbi:PBSX family phage terminase large subunit [Dyadobacter chenwenxiniae]|uniref:PBSX family phage terminase large subunit n=1 Tax=Dyadobacter chenwenxiniae TaxID=2906456 RepID=A0A9X1PI87_9BACT|nr:PBSX family phage terminase large subunit [Dyadobacter chenwenxiniae]MCF0059958.1 PBSX family phage terminase large subunit [Dyadobacter chenwenxiniae]UON85697.1 PBSX family phage terminase large subunit [Dyadobacter chenwenxiniae]